MGFLKAVSASKDSPRLPVPSARYRPGYPFPGCAPAEPESVFPDTLFVSLGNVRCKISLDAGALLKTNLDLPIDSAEEPKLLDNFGKEIRPLLIK